MSPKKRNDEISPQNIHSTFGRETSVVTRPTPVPQVGISSEGASADVSTLFQPELGI